MIDKLISWFRTNVYPGESEPPIDLRQTGVRVRPPQEREDGTKVNPGPKSKPQDLKEDLNFTSEVGGRIEDAGPGKNVFVRSKYVREDAGTHDSLKIIDEDSLEVEEDGGGIDPYNTGQFDSSDKWNKRFRK